MNLFKDSIRREREYAGVIENIKTQMLLRRRHPMQVTGLCEGARAAFYAALAEDFSKESDTPCLILLPDEKEIMRVSISLAELGVSSVVYPWRDFVYHDITASHEFEYDRLSALSAIIHNSVQTVLTVPDAALQYTMPREILEVSERKIISGSEISQEELTEYLLSVGYTRVDTVDGAGQYTVRGGILDVYPPRYEYPVRMEFFGDEIDSMGYFDIITQRRIENVSEIVLSPAREIFVSNESLRALGEKLSEMVKKSKDAHQKELFARELEAVNSGTELRFIDKYISFMYPQSECLLDYFGDNSRVIIQEYNSCSDRLKSYEWHQNQSAEELLSEGAVWPDTARYGKAAYDFDGFAEEHSAVIVDTFLSNLRDMRLSGSFHFLTKQTSSYADNIPLLAEDLKNYIDSGFESLVLCENEMSAKNLINILSENGIQAVGTAENREEYKNIPVVMYGTNLQGYELTASRFAVLSTCRFRGTGLKKEIARRKHTRAKKSAKEKILSYAELEVGDYVVHANHGIGMYMGMQSVTVEGITKDYLKIKYAGTDVLYLPCNQLEMISKYIGARSEDGTLKLSRMGGTEWVKAKTKVKTAAKEMAKELIRLYAERQRRSGFAFPHDDEMQQEFEQAFEYEETDAQLQAIREIKSDMETARPMDRLLCGDVGYGKTEVALRAAFKAVEAGKQVAMLVPTTILAMQHYQTFLSRMRGFPVQVDMLSRFRGPKQQQETLRKLKRGEVDILVGTHRIVSEDIVFKDLGLIIVDEEQRFGVAHKEKLKKISANADVLTLSATPIPRTLNMAMSGIRDMSILDEAPRDRFPVQTYVLEYDDMIIGEAIRKELRRGGQVFYLNNRVDSIDRIAAKVREMAPDAVVASAHGQMDKETLSDIWRAMINGDIDILISTTIIESGVDIPNANTLIIENADKLGLSQLHQIRGRVGRSGRRAYAYFTYPKGLALTEVAEKRLGAIRDYTEFGSGFKVALRDMEIRGAGNVLGSEQHGHMETVGYDLYMKLLNEAVLEEKGEKTQPKTECTVDLNVNAFIPEKYIPTSAQRIDAYKKVAMIETDEDYADILDELVDRYGEPPRQVAVLLYISLIRALGQRCGIIKIEQKGNSVIMYPAVMDGAKWSETAAEFRGRLMLNLSSSPYVSYSVKRNDDMLDYIAQILKKYIQIGEQMPKK